MQLLPSITISLLLMMSLLPRGQAQLSPARIDYLADVKVQRVQDMLDLHPLQAKQLKEETSKLITSQGAVATSANIISEYSKNQERYYRSLSKLTSDQVSTLRLMDELERVSRRDAYSDMLATYNQNSDFAIAVAAYNWNTIIPLLVSYRRDLEKHISKNDKATIAAVRASIIAKYDLVTDVYDQRPSAESGAILDYMSEELLTDIKESQLRGLITKYDDDMADVRRSLAVHEAKIKRDIKAICDAFLLDNQRDQLTTEQEFLEVLGIGKIWRDAFFLLMDPDSRSISFKVNATRLIVGQVLITDQF